MATVTKRQLVERITEATDQKQVVVSTVAQMFLDAIIAELGKGNRLEFRDFGVFDVKQRRARKAQNPRTLEPVEVPSRRGVRFKPGRRMKQVVLAER